MIITQAIKINSILKPSIYIALIIGIYYTILKFLFKEWNNEDFTYCYLVPFIVLYLLWEKRDSIFNSISKASWIGTLILLIGILFFWVGELGGEYYSQFISIWLVIIALVLSHFGWKKTKQIWFPLALITAAFTPPDFIYFRLSLKLKLISSQLGVYLMQLYGMSAYREGNIIDLGFTQLQVVDACSGLRYLFPLFVLGILLAYFYKASLWKKIVLIISTIPITIITNSLRIALTGILSEIWGPKVAEGFFHGFSGWFIFMTALGIMLLEMLALNGFRSLRTYGWLKSSKGKSEEANVSKDDTSRQAGMLGDQEANDEGGDIGLKAGLRGSREAIKGDAGSSDGQNELNDQTIKPSPKGFRAFFTPPQFVVAVVLLGLTLILSQGIEFRENIPVAKSFDEFPLEVGGWNGKRQSLQEKILEALDLSDYIIIDYKSDTNKWVNFYTAYYESQRKGESIHSPASCLPGSGWEFKEGGSAVIPMPGFKNEYMPVNRAFMVKSGYKQLSYYWFPQRDRILTNAWQLKIFNFWDALTRQRTDGALVRLITPVYENEKLEDAEKRLQAFTQKIVPVLGEFLPN